MVVRDVVAAILVGLAVYGVVVKWFTPEKCYKQVVVENVVIGNWDKENCEILKALEEENEV